MLIEVELERHPVDHVHLLVVGERDVGRRQLALEALAALGIAELVVRLAHARGLELAGHRLILDHRILRDLVIEQQLFPGLRQVLVGGDGGDQRAEGEIALDHQVAADRVVEEGAELIEEVVEELGEELELVDAVADLEDAAEPVRDVGQLEVRGVVDVDLEHPLDGLADPVRELAHQAHALFRQQVHAPLQPRDDVDLERVEGDGGESHDRVLYEQEAEDGEELAAELGRARDRHADEAAQGLHLLGDHGDDLALAQLAEGGQREPQYPAVEVVAQPPQHALAQEPGVDIDVVLEGAVDHHQAEEDAAKHEQVGYLIELQAQQLGGEVLGLGVDGVVDDLFGQVEREIYEGHRHRGNRQQDELRAQAEADDVTEDALFHGPPP